ncbi:MAG: hypothetical protein ACRC9L_04140 [Brevinema sp.]
MKNIVFLSLLVGLTACNLTSLRVVEDAPVGGDISGDINLPTVEVPNSSRPINNPMEFSNRAALAQFNVDVTDLTQYNSNVTTTDNVGSYNWYFDNTTNPTRIVRSTAIFSVVLNSIIVQELNSYTVTRLPDNTFTSFVLTGSRAPVQLPNGGTFLRLTRVFERARYFVTDHNNTGVGATLSDWADYGGPDTIIIWVKFFGDFAWVVTGSNPTSVEFMFDEDPINAPVFTSR